MMKKVLVLAALAACFSARPALAQRGEVSATVGWTFSDGVDSSGTVLGPDGNLYNRLDPKDSFRWGLDVGFYTTENVEVGFMWNMQMSKLIAKGPTVEKEVNDWTINQYHGYFAYNMGDSDARLRPYFLFGLGATNYGSVTFASGFESGTETQFSTTWGAGVKFFAGPKVGARFGVQWTPTYIKSDPGGWWCDPYWGCYLVGDAQYSNAWDLGGGVIFKF